MSTLEIVLHNILLHYVLEENELRRLGIRTPNNMLPYCSVNTEYNVFNTISVTHF